MRHLATATLDADEGLQRVIGLRSAVLSGNLVKVVTTAAKIGALAALPVMAIVASLLERPVESLAGLGLLALGLPAYWYWGQAAVP